MKMMSVLIIVMQAVIYVMLAPAIVGTLHWMQARLQARRGQDIFQLYRDLFKLLLKKATLPEHVSHLYIAMPSVLFVCYLLPAFSLPILGVPSPLRVDLVFIVYLLGLAHFISALAALEVGGPFGAIGSSRQLFLHVLIEPVLLVVAFALLLLPPLDSTSGSMIQIWLRYLLNPALLSVLCALAVVAVSEVGLLPFDNPETKLELTMIERAGHLEYSGPGLALIEWAGAMKLTFFLALVAEWTWPQSWPLVAPMQADGTLSVWLLAALLVFICKLAVLLLILAILQNALLKIRVGAVVTPLLVALGLAVIAVVYTTLTASITG